MRNNTVIALCLLAIAGCMSSSASADWKGLWRTPQQQALEAYENSDYESLLNDAPDDSWSGLGHFQTGDFSAASQAFAEHVQQLQATGDSEAATRALYNQGVSNVMAGQFEQAIEQFDQALSENPDFTQARHNRDIAQKLLAMQQQETPTESGDSGDSGENPDQQEGQSQQNGESSQQSDANDGGQPDSTERDVSPDGTDDATAQGDSSSADSQGEESSDAAMQSETEQDQEATDALEALAAEAARQEESSSEPLSEGSDELKAGAMTERPLSEAEQATEQLLRRIPDDPAGLLRRKLEQSHRNEFPEVRNAAEPW